ncbi:MAG: YtfJ family protein [Desulforegulaceae bacterium]|nr:YtfJ family protein [Desulforegulaceae bacterium]
MKKLFFLIQALFLTGFISLGISAEIKVGTRLPQVKIEDKGIFTFDYEIQNKKMTIKKNSQINYRPWSLAELEGKVSTIYHLAARTGIDEINKDYIDALIEADFPANLPDSPYKTTTILNMDDALWGTSKIAVSRFHKSQVEFPYAYYVVDGKGKALEKWGLKTKESAVIIIDKKGEVLFFKEGKLTPEEINLAILKIREALNK